ncbi:hypothetical protein SAMN06265379_101949 [Saccharicrinis carchari]|uniref:Cell division protein ZapB n=1 Tax=Saccharicrinis carchari TaxID=1168039 RepID=A0A521BIJ9_SACCC|nr:hypothetical protein [Saccharicrinis carchari]SMO46721.1 hypothetical protein SAMN06265379_101949 [Saccharicrinis carchari]
MRNIISPLTSSSPWGRLGGAPMVNLAELNKLLLQKVEELTLYAIELEKARKKEHGAREDLEQQVKRLTERLAKIEALLTNDN